MKMIAGFVIGVIVCMLALWGISNQTQAAGETSTLPDETDLTGLMRISRNLPAGAGAALPAGRIGNHHRPLHSRLFRQIYGGDGAGPDTLTVMLQVLAFNGVGQGAKLT